MAANETRLSTTPTPNPVAAATSMQAIVAAHRLASRERRRRRLDLFLLTLLLVFAFALASTPVRNSDFLMHLATGRALTNGTYSFGTDPFSYTSEGLYWTNHAWFFDLVLYLCYQVAGVPGIIVLKGIGTVGLALLLVRISRIGTSLWWPIVTSGLALLCVAPRLLLIQPTLVSFVLLPATLGVLLWRGGWWKTNETTPAAPTPIVPWHYWPLWPLLVLWVNCDEWFVLGLVTIGLFALGRVLQNYFSKQTEPIQPGELRALGIAFAGGIAVCLLNPHHFHAFQIPSTLGWFGTAGKPDLDRDAFYQTLYYTPVQKEYYQANFGLSVAGMAVAPLALIGLLSFLLNFRTLRYWRLLMWVAFLLLALSHARAIPFFALIAGPITALNFQDHSRPRWSDVTKLPIPLRRWLFLGRLVTILGFAALIVLCWPGWIHAQPYSTKRIAFEDDLDPTLTESAKALKKMRDDGVFGPQARGFSYSPEMANYLAWYCPEEKSFFDFRYHLHAKSAKEYVDIRRGLRLPSEVGVGEDGVARPRPVVDWSALLKNRKVTHVILYSTEPAQLRQQAVKFTDASNEWTLLHVDGHTLVYGYNEAGTVQQSAYRPEKEVFNPPEARQINPQGPLLYPQPRTTWDEFVEPQAKRDMNIDEANMWLMLFDAESQASPGERMRAWELSMFLSGLSNGPGAFPFLLPTHLLTSFNSLRDRAQRDGSGESRKGVQARPVEALALTHLEGYGTLATRRCDYYPLLAVRAARRALAKNFQDAGAHMALAEAYLKLQRLTKEPLYQSDGPFVGAHLINDFREIQIVTAFTQALALNPDLEGAHLMLADYYGNRNYLDLAHKHSEKALRLSKQRGPLTGETVSSTGKDGTYEKRIKDLEDKVARLQTSLQKQEDQYELQSATFKDDEQRALRAHQMGLADKALDIMKKTDEESIKKFKPASGVLYLRLLLETGQVKELTEGYDKNFEKILGTYQFQRYRALIAMSHGNYEEAERALAVYTNLLRDAVKKVPLAEGVVSAQEKDILSVIDPLEVALREKKQTWEARWFIAALAAKEVVDFNPQFGSPLSVYMSLPRFAQQQQKIGQYINYLHQFCEVYVVRGLLAMEVCDTAAAAEHFSRALKEWNTGWDGTTEGINPFRDYDNRESAWTGQGHHMHLYAAEYLKQLKKHGK